MNKHTGTLSASEAKLLYYFMQRPDTLVTSAELGALGWKKSVIYTNIWNLRKKGANFTTVRTQPNGWKWHRKETK